MAKKAVLAGLGDFYSQNQTGYSELKFTLKNIADLSTQLETAGWETSPALFNETTEKKFIIEKLTESINSLTKEDDWLLFYYTGHAARYLIQQSENNTELVTYCVTYSSDLRFDFLPDIRDFFSEMNYDDIINLFHQKAPSGHLITILDCCFAFGLIENFATQTDFHTIIAASSENRSAAYSKNSSFFLAFRQCWDLPFDQLQTRVRSLMRNMQSPNIAKIQIAQNFIDHSLNTQI